VFEFRALILIVPFTEYGWLFDIEVYLIFEYSMTTMHPFVISPVSVSFLLLQVLFGCYMNMYICIYIYLSRDVAESQPIVSRDILISKI
jgi:hypothetical protein